MTMATTSVPLYTSFYTEDYATYADNLVRSFDRFGLEHYVRAAPDLGSWQRNCQYKPRWLWDVMTRNLGRPVVWVDADAEVLHFPGLFDKLDCDFAAVLYERKDTKRAEVLSGTVYLGGTTPAFRLVDKWIEMCSVNPGHWDQRCLEMAVNETDPLRKEWLPVEYAFIFDTFRSVFPKVEPVIEHFQHSRQTRRKKL